MFEGFTEETIAFFAALSVNNNREFFEANRAVYERAVRAPLMALAEGLAPTVSAIDPQMDTRPGRAVSRIHRDLRFRKDKTPYRDYMWIGFRHVGEARAETCGFYFDLSAGGANWGCGYYHMRADAMEGFRRLLRERPKAVLKVVGDEALTRDFALMGDAYVRTHRPPEGMPEALKALYPKKTLYAEHRLKDMQRLFSPGLLDEITRGFETLAPFYTLLRSVMVKRIEGV